MNGVRIHRRTSQDIAPMTKRRCGGGRPTDRPSDGKIKAARRAVVGWLE
jgi:hypothetical protein